MTISILRILKDWSVARKEKVHRNLEQKTRKKLKNLKICSESWKWELTQRLSFLCLIKQEALVLYWIRRDRKEEKILRALVLKRVLFLIIRFRKFKRRIVSMHEKDPRTSITIVALKVRKLVQTSFLKIQPKVKVNINVYSIISKIENDKTKYCAC